MQSFFVSEGPDERIVLIVHRSLSRSYSQNLFDRSRKWSPEDLQAVIGAVQSALPSSKKQLRVVVYSDQDRNIMECIPCQIRLFSVASVVVGVRSFQTVNSFVIASPLAQYLYVTRRLLFRCTGLDWSTLYSCLQVETSLKLSLR